MKPDKKKITKTLSQEEYERRIAELQNELEELKKVKVEDNKPKKGKIWTPELDEDFFYFDENGALYGEEYCDVVTDNLKLDIGNFYKTSEEAKHQLEVQKYTNLFRKYVEEHSEPLDWKNSTQQKLYIYYNKRYGVISTGIELINASQGTIYSSSNEVLIDALNFIGKENAIKYLFNVKED